MKRCGIAVTDPLQIIVNGLATVSQPELIEFVINYCKENQVEKIILGYPLQSDGAKTQLSIDIENLVAKLNTFLPQVNIKLYDEKKSSRKAFQVILQSGAGKKKRRDKSLLDKISAVIILQRYLGHI